VLTGAGSIEEPVTNNLLTLWMSFLRQHHGAVKKRLSGWLRQVPSVIDKRERLLPRTDGTAASHGFAQHRDQLERWPTGELHDEEAACLIARLTGS
jgi:hypothetical protein